jgi:hypothetical protein
MDLGANEAVDPAARPGVFHVTPWPNVAIVGRKPGLAEARPQRADFLNAMRAASKWANVVVIDTGPMLIAPAAAVLAQHVQAVVLTIPVPRQRRVTLERIAQQLVPIQRNVLPVETPALPSATSSRMVIVDSSPGYAGEAASPVSSPEVDDDAELALGGSGSRSRRASR